MNVWFVTPAHGRLDVSKMVYDHRLWAMKKLWERGIEAQCVVIAEDENLELAMDSTFEVVQMPNDGGLGRKWNAGYKYAAEHGATHIVPTGSDTWLDTDWITVDCSGCIQINRNYSIVDRLGQSRIQLWLGGWPYGCHMCFPVWMIAACDYSPIEPQRNSACDWALWQKISMMDASVHFNEVHPLEAVAWRSDTQISDDKRLYNLWGIGRVEPAFGMLSDVHPEELVQAAKMMYQKRDPRYAALLAEIERLKGNDDS